MNEYFYETGSTQPPKSRILIVIFLVLLIFVGGIVTALGILNIKLWSDLSPREDEAVSLRFTREESSTAAQFAAPEITGAPGAPGADLGFTTETVSGFLRAYYRLPQGVYIPQVTEGSHAASAGVRPGDILLAINGQQITDTDSLNKQLRRCSAGETVTLTLYRDGKELDLELTLH